TMPSNAVVIRFRVIPALLRTWCGGLFFAIACWRLVLLVAPRWRAPVFFFPLVVNPIQLRPLVWRQDLADAEQLQRAHLVQARARRFHLVQLLRDDAFVGIGGNQTRQFVFLLVQFGLLRALRAYRGLKQVFNSSGLVGGQRQVALELRIAPPWETKRLSPNRCRQRQQH